MRRLIQFYGYIRPARWVMLFLVAACLLACPVVATIWALAVAIIIPIAAMEEDPDQDRINHLLHFQALNAVTFATSLGALAMGRYFFGWFDGVTVQQLASIIGILYGIGLLAHIATAIPAFENMYRHYKHYNGDI